MSETIKKPEDQKEFPTVTMPETPETDKVLDLTEIEAKESEKHHGIRGTIKKILRPFKDEQRKIFEQYTKAVAESLSGEMDRAYKAMNAALAELEKKNRQMYSTVVRHLFYKLEVKVHTADVYVKAVIEEMAEYVAKQTLPALSDPCSKEDYDNHQAKKQEIVKGFHDAVQKRAEEISKKLNEEAQKQELAAQEAAKKKAEEETKEKADVVEEQKAADIQEAAPSAAGESATSSESNPQNGN